MKVKFVSRCKQVIGSNFNIIGLVQAAWAWKLGFVWRSRFILEIYSSPSSFTFFFFHVQQQILQNSDCSIPTYSISKFTQPKPVTWLKLPHADSAECFVYVECVPPFLNCTSTLSKTRGCELLQTAHVVQDLVFNVWVHIWQWAPVKQFSDTLSWRCFQKMEEFLLKGGNKELMRSRQCASSVHDTRTPPHLSL